MTEQSSSNTLYWSTSPSFFTHNSSFATRKKGRWSFQYRVLFCHPEFNFLYSILRVILTILSLVQFWIVFRNGFLIQHFLSLWINIPVVRLCGFCVLDWILCNSKFITMPCWNVSSTISNLSFISRTWISVNDCIFIYTFIL